MRQVGTHPAVTKVITRYAKESEVEEVVACRGRGILGEEHRVCAKEGNMVASSGRRVLGDEPAVSAGEKSMVDRGKGGGNGGDENDGVGTGEQQEHPPLQPPLPPPPPAPPPLPPPAVAIRVTPEAEEHALVVERRLILGHRALVSYQKHNEEVGAETVVVAGGARSAGMERCGQQAVAPAAGAGGEEGAGEGR